MTQAEFQLGGSFFCSALNYADVARVGGEEHEDRPKPAAGASSSGSASSSTGPSLSNRDIVAQRLRREIGDGSNVDDLVEATALLRKYSARQGIGEASDVKAALQASLRRCYEELYIP